MDAELKAKWVAALRSGEYKQGQMRLRTSDKKFCCLGVLCDIQGADFAVIEKHYGSLSLSENPQEYLGSIGDVSAKLAQMNDTGSSFTEIADYIEANL